MNECAGSNSNLTPKSPVLSASGGHCSRAGACACRLAGLQTLAYGGGAVRHAASSVPLHRSITQTRGPARRHWAEPSRALHTARANLAAPTIMGKRRGPVGSSNSVQLQSTLFHSMLQEQRVAPQRARALVPDSWVGRAHTGTLLAPVHRHSSAPRQTSAHAHAHAHDARALPSCAAHEPEPYEQYIS